MKVMKDESYKHEGCELCALTRKVHGDKFEGCGHISAKMAEGALKGMMDMSSAMMQEVDAKFRAGEITRDEHAQAIRNAQASVGVACATLPAIATIEGPRAAPHEMMAIVQAKMSAVVARVLSKKFADLGITVEEAPSAPNPNPNAGPTPLESIRAERKNKLN